ncbi:MAG TPA: glycosyltransferase, partial [Solirubrobacterales bacterium]|nr:glycosyltransferase [Solirubrobacterales bacterium]
MSASPAISVLMPVRDGARFLVEAVESVLAQSFSDLELVVVDDGSTDSTPRLLEQIAGRDSRLVVHRRRPGRNLAEVLNLAAELSRAPLLARLDADDVALPERLRLQVEFLDAHPEVALLGGQALMIDEAGRDFGRAEYPQHDDELRQDLQAGNPFVHPAVAMRRQAFEAVGGYRVNFDYAEDLDLWLRLAEGRKIANLADVVVKYRIHGGQQTVRKQDEQALYALAARASAKVREAGRPDPFQSGPIDEASLLSLGVSREEIAAAVVDATTWIGRTTDRAGYS